MSVLGRFHPVLLSTALYAGVTLASGNQLLVMAAVVVGLVTAVQRQLTSGLSWRRCSPT